MDRTDTAGPASGLLRGSRASEPLPLGGRSTGLAWGAHAIRGAVLALSALVAWSCSAEATLQTPSVQVIREPIERIVVATGTIEPEREVEVRSRIAGVVEHIHVKPGDRVESGQMLVELDRELTQVEVRAAKAEVESAQVDLGLAESELRRVARLLKQGAATPRQVEEARAKRDIARAALERVSATAEQLEVRLRYSTLEAPIAGKILAVLIEEGSAVAGLTAVSGGTVLLKLAQEHRLHLLGLVDENEIGHLQPGQSARVTTEAFADRVFDARVREIAPLGERRQNVTYFEVEVELVGDVSGLRPKMSGNAEIIADTVKDALVIPETALRYEDGQVWVDRLRGEDGSQGGSTRVELGIVTPGRVQILSGLQAGERIRIQ